LARPRVLVEETGAKASPAPFPPPEVDWHADDADGAPVK
jgi:hypothetical protein